MNMSKILSLKSIYQLPRLLVSRFIFVIRVDLLDYKNPVFALFSHLALCI
jgi:hypothetical protein